VGISVNLCVGDFLLDTVTRDKGLLLRRCVEGAIHGQSNFELLVWEIFWNDEKHTYYTEEAIVNMIVDGRLQLFKNN
jgi:hypothetical protein